jgi:hypothetical protein
MKIEDLKVYDPKQDGLDFQSYSKEYDSLFAINMKKAYDFNDSLYQKIQNSKVESGVTLDKFLDDFFANQDNIVAVVFVDGKLYSQLDRTSYKKLNLDEIAKETGSIPFAFSYFPEVEEYLKK